MRTPRTIAIIGASFGGLTVARKLEPYLEHAHAEAVLLDARPYHEFPPLLYEVATGAVEGRPEDCERILASGVCMNRNTFAHLFRGRPIRFLAAEVVGVNRLHRTLQFRDGTTLAYDVLVLAYGARPAYYGIPGLEEHALTLKTTTDALRIRRRILDLRERTAAHPDARFAVCIGGAGATGIEFTAELANTLRRAIARGDLRASSYTLTLVDIASRPLAMFPERASQIALQRLHALDVRVHLDCRVTAATPHALTIAPRALRDGEQRDALLCGFSGDTCTLPADLVVWTGGIAPAALGRDAGFASDASGRIRVGVDGMVADERATFALGDCALFVHPWTKRPLPALASVAIREAATIARNVIAVLREEPLRRFWPRELPSIVPLGGKRALIAYRGRVAWGWWPWALHHVVALRYFVSVLGVLRGCALWWRGAHVYVQND